MEGGKGTGISKAKGIVKQTGGGDDILSAAGLKFQKELYDADLDTEG
jgi:hypothetical protein